MDIFPLCRGRRFWLVACCMAAAFVLVAGREEARLPDGRSHAFILDVGQGDAIVLRSPSGKHILVDAGPDASVLSGLGHVLPYFDRHLDLVIITHPDTDHLGGLPEVLRRYDVSALLITPSALADDNTTATRALIAQEGSRIIFPDPARDIDLGDGLLLNLLWPPPHQGALRTEDPNDLSIVLRAETPSGSLLMMGDLPEQEEEMLLAQGIPATADFLKLGHHGSKTSSSKVFLNAVHPSLALISVGKENRFGHPSPEVLARLQELGIPMRSTAEEGMIPISF
ncbi:MAG: MBL fold metallo-hydrolase [Candidatus Peribacteraceae bacterium]|nr:MBL fold metallo-hydrolase [Candidatus Peribacteraceae bacterium]